MFLKTGLRTILCVAAPETKSDFSPAKSDFGLQVRRTKKVFLGKRWKFGFMREFCVVFLLWQGKKHSNGCSIASIFDAVTVKIRRKRPHIIRTFNASFCDA